MPTPSRKTSSSGTPPCSTCRRGNEPRYKDRERGYFSDSSRRRRPRHLHRLGDDQWSEVRNRRIGADYGIEFLSQLMAAVGVESWEKLPGTHVRAETEGTGGRCLRIGHILKNQWFDPEKLSRDMKEQEQAVTR